MMKIASFNHLSELGMEDSIFFHQYPTTTTDSFTCPLNNFENQYSFRSESTESDSYFNYETKPNRFPVESPKPSFSPPSPAQLISFDQSSIASHQYHNHNQLGFNTKPVVVEKGCNNNNTENTGYTTLVSQGSYEEEDDKVVSNYDDRKNHVSKNTIQAQEHVLAERKRREKLTRSFIALSAIVPGLKKMDKASVLGDAVKYMKQLQERVQTLEDQAVKNGGGSTVLVKRSILFTDDVDDIDNSSRGSNCDSNSLPDIEVRVSGKDVLIKIQCNKQSRRVTMILGELEKHNLSVQSSSFLPFGNNIVDVTIVAQMNKENCVTAKDLLGILRQALTV